MECLGPEETTPGPGQRSHLLHGFLFEWRLAFGGSISEASLGSDPKGETAKLKNKDQAVSNLTLLDHTRHTPPKNMCVWDMFENQLHWLVLCFFLFKGSFEATDDETSFPRASREDARMHVFCFLKRVHIIFKSVCARSIIIQGHPIEHYYPPPTQPHPTHLPTHVWMRHHLPSKSNTLLPKSATFRNTREFRSKHTKRNCERVRRRKQVALIQHNNMLYSDGGENCNDIVQTLRGSIKSARLLPRLSTR